jgi:peptidyl-dipeptidase A
LVESSLPFQGYQDTGAYWRSKYESNTFQEDLKGLLDQLKPLYQELHTYVRKQLRKQYGTENFPVSGHIPAHLLGKYMCTMIKFLNQNF